jgi:hypothetical protein
LIRYTNGVKESKITVTTKEALMAKVALSVSSDYLPNWGAYEGLRELVQNFIDSQDDCGVKGTVSYEGGSYTGKVILTNHGAKPLNREALLFGVTSKANRADQRGQFGEGMKVGTLALVRESRAVTIRTQTENWVASLQTSTEFGGRKVLTFTTHKRQTVTDNVSVEIYPVYKEEWDKIQQSFMFMQEDVEGKDSYYGKILTGDTFRNKVFAKGIFVKNMEGMKWGYDLSNMTLNRDRSMVDEWDVRNNIVSLLTSLYQSGELTLADIRGLFDNNHWEAQSSYAWSYSPIIRDMLREYVKDQDGKNCIVSASNDEIVKAESFGWNSVRVPKSLADAFGQLLTADHYADFRKEIGLSTFAEMMNEMRDSVCKIYASDDLSPEENETLAWAVDVLARVDVTVDPTVVKFVREGELLGLYKGGDISIARSLLTDKVETLATLVHEYSHNFGSDGTIAHSSAIESLWTKIAKSRMS